MPNPKIISLLALTIIGFAIPVMPNTIDLGEMILMGIFNAGSCTSDFCIETQKTLLNYYNIAGLIMGSLSLYGLYRMRNSS